MWFLRTRDTGRGEGASNQIIQCMVPCYFSWSLSTHEAVKTMCVNQRTIVAVVRHYYYYYLSRNQQHTKQQQWQLYEHPFIDETTKALCGICNSHDNGRATSNIDLMIWIILSRYDTDNFHFHYIITETWKTREASRVSVQCSVDSLPVIIKIITYCN